MDVFMYDSFVSMDVWFLHIEILLQAYRCFGYTYVYVNVWMFI